MLKEVGVGELKYIFGMLMVARLIDLLIDSEPEYSQKFDQKLNVLN